MIVLDGRAYDKRIKVLFHFVALVYEQISWPLGICDANAIALA
jgi:hypothetical protein